MKMTGEYLTETTARFAEVGFTVAVVTDQDTTDGELHYDRDRHILTRGTREHIEIEHITYPDGTVAWWLMIVTWHGLRADSFPMDSWKHRSDRVEFKFMASQETGLGLALVVHLDALD
ncbi:MAG: hypothetical protein ACJAZO_001408 [Myxococcota bacterium]|jgi:hypothetical protein